MANQTPDEQNLDHKLQQALEREHLTPETASKRAESSAADMSGLAYGMRLGTEFLGGTLVGVAIGFFLDKALNTAPWFILIFTFLGFGAGMLNAYRFIMQMDDNIGANRADYLTKTAQPSTSDAGDNPPKNST